MKKRLRKQHHLGEFRQFGFSLESKFGRVLSPAEFDAFVVQFITDAIEANGLLFGGGGSPTRGWSGVVQRDHRYDSTTDDHRKVLSDWLKARPEIEQARVSATWDIWHGTDPFGETRGDAGRAANRSSPPTPISPGAEKSG